MKNIGTLKFGGETLGIFLTAYRDGNKAIQLVSHDGLPYTTFSVNIPGEPLEPNEICVKTWFEHESLRDPMLATGLFTDTGKRVLTGHAEAEVWKLHV